MENYPKKISDLESLLEFSLSKSLRASEIQTLFSGHRAHVSLTDKNGRKKKCNAAATNWSPESGQIRITFEVDSSEVPSPKAQPEIPQNVAPSSALEDFVRNLDRVEARPGYDFVALKWFRDAVLPDLREEWKSPEERNRVIREAIEKRLVLTNKVPNPKSPQFPVTALRLNRSLPETQAILGTHNATAAEFQPVAIRGEDISTTVLRERR